MAGLGGGMDFRADRIRQKQTGSASYPAIFLKHS